MRNKRLVAAMTVLSLAMTPTRAWAVDITADPADATNAGATIEALADQGSVTEGTSAGESPETGAVEGGGTVEDTTTGSGAVDGGTTGGGTTGGGATDSGATEGEKPSAGDATTGSGVQDGAASGDADKDASTEVATGPAAADRGSADDGADSSNAEKGEEDVDERSGTTRHAITGVSFNESADGSRSLTVSISDDGTPRRIFIDGRMVSFADYDFAAGTDSGVITVYGSALSGLAAGSHSIKVVFENVTNDTAYFTVGGGEVDVKHEVSDGGTWIHGSGENLSFLTNATVAPQQVSITGPMGMGTVILGSGQYSVAGKPGNLEISLSGAYLETLPAGNYTLGVCFADGDYDAGAFNIAGTFEPGDDGTEGTDYTLTGGGEWTQGSGAVLSFTSNATSAPEWVAVDGSLLSEGEQYKAYVGDSSTLIVLFPSYLGSLSVGGHEIKVNFGGNDEPYAGFTVVAAEEEEGIDHTLVGGGAWERGSEYTLQFDTNAIVDPLWVAVSGEGVGDLARQLTPSVDYKVSGEAGKLQIELLAGGYLGTLPVGDYELKVHFADGDERTATFSVVEPETPEVDIVHGVADGGDWVRGSDHTLSFGTNASEDPLSVSVSGGGEASVSAVLTAGVDYKVSGDVGALDVELLPGYLSTLALGDYELTVTFADGDVDTATFGVVEGVARDYVITYGNGSSWEQETDAHLPFETNGHADDLTGVIINGQALVEGEDYTVFDGDENSHGDNVGVMLTDEYLDTLAVDEHDILVAFADGDADGSFFVTAADDGIGDGTGGAGSGTGGGAVARPRSAGDGIVTSTGGGGVMPRTGDPAAAVGGLVGAGALLGAIGAALRRRRELGNQEG